MCLLGSSNALVMPLILKALIESIGDGDRSKTQFFLALLLGERFLCMVIEMVGARLLITSVPARIMSTLAGLIANKASHPCLRGKHKAGVDPVALVGREISMLYMKLSMFLHMGFMAVPSLLAGSITLLYLLGWSALVGVVWICFTIFLGAKMQERGKRVEERMSAIATQRLKLLMNILGAIKAIKYCGWEVEFLNEMLEVRTKECSELRAKIRYVSLATTLGKVTPVTASLATFVTFALLGNDLKASDIFACNSVFMTMRFAVGASGMLFEVWKSIQLVLSRTQRFLTLGEQEFRAPLPAAECALGCTKDLRVMYKPDEDDRADKQDSLGFELRADGVLALGESGKVTAICGAVGSGKSLLLSALLGACDGEPDVQGTSSVTSDVAWVPQRPFLISGTIQDNILLGRELHSERLHQCLSEACFGDDLLQLKGGLDEVVGERGTTLSGGQQARLCLARALYANPSLLLLDDPLAAVDASVGRALLHALRVRCTRPQSGGSVPPGAVVVVNQLHLLPNFDNIVFLKAGRVVQRGSFSEICKEEQVSAFLAEIEFQVIPVDSELDLSAAQREFDQARLALDKHGLSKESNGHAQARLENAAVGLVRWSVLRTYLLAPGKPFFVLTIITFIFTYATLGLRDWWLAVWADNSGGNKAYYIGLFVMFSAMHLLFSCFCVALIGAFAERAGQNLHSDSVHPLMHAKMSYFDETPSGRITSRLGPDLGQIDGMMPGQIDFSMTFGFTFLVMCLTVTVKLPWMAFLFLMAGVISVPVAHGLIIFRQDVKRHSNNAMAPVLSNLSEIQRGALTASILNCHDFFKKRHLEYCDWWTLLSDASSLTAAVGQVWCTGYTL